MTTAVADAARWRRLRPPLADALIAVAFVVLSVAEALTSSDVRQPMLFLLLTGAAMASLAWRRRAPLLIAVIVVSVNLVVNPSNEFSTLLSLVLVAYTVGSECRPPLSYVGLALIVVPFVGVSVQQDLEPSDLAAALVFFVGPWTVGWLVSSRAARTEAAVARVEQLERDREAEAERAAAEERTRIARELHDIVSHSISVITIQTQAVRRRLRPDQVDEARDLAAVEATAREAMAEMRRTFGVLRAQGGGLDLAPQPGLAELERLVAQANSSDVTVRLTVTGEPAPLSPGLDLAAYRIAQEGLTNALRHSGARVVDVAVRYRTGTVEIEVVDDGRGLPDDTDGGHGLIGVRERAALYGGTVDLGTGPAGGLRLTATLPAETVR